MEIIGTGIDIVSKKRFKNKDKLINRFLNKDELNLLSSLSKEEKINFISGRWVAKESIIKASNKKITFSQISILKCQNGKPLVYVDGKKRGDIQLSISHEKYYTLAFSILLKV